MWPNFRKIIPHGNSYRGCSPDLVEIDIVKYYLSKHNIDTIIDLRTDAEKGENSLHLKNIVSKYYSIHIQDCSNTFKNILHPSSEDYICYYTNIIQYSKKNILSALKIFENYYNEYNILLYCHAAKDRTGIISWILHELACFDEDLIVKEFTTSHKECLENSYIFINNWEKRGLSKESYMRRFMSKENIIETIRKKIIDDHGGLDNFFDYNFDLLRNKLHQHAEEYN